MQQKMTAFQIQRCKERIADEAQIQKMMEKVRQLENSMQQKVTGYQFVDQK